MWGPGVLGGWVHAVVEERGEVSQGVLAMGGFIGKKKA